MDIELKVPALGESVAQATVGAWLKREGDWVDADEPVVEVESEKATGALPAPSAGVLSQIVKPQGATVVVGEVIGRMEKREKPMAPPVPQPERPLARHIPAPPSARRLMAENELAEGRIQGSGRAGRIVKEDVLRALEDREGLSEMETRGPEHP